MSPCIRTLLVVGLVLIPTLNAASLFGTEEGDLNNQIRELLEKPTDKETTREFSQADLVSTIKGLNDKFIEYIVDNKIDDIVSMYDHDVLRISGGKSSIGVDGFADQFQLWVPYIVSADIKTTALTALDDDAKFVLEAKYVELEIAGSSKPDKRESVLVWKKTPAGYKVALELSLRKRQ